MAGYWGATADPNYGYSPYSGQLHYEQHQYASDPFTPPPGDDNPLTIEQIEMRIMNAHPEQIAALADQWVNAWTLLSNVRSYVLQQSNVLHDEHWKSPQARDAFLRKGPGEALAYLDVWMDAAQQNIVALRHLVNITQDARDEMEELMRQYRQALEDAKNVSFGEQWGEWVNWDDRKWTTTWGDAEKYEIQQGVDRTTREYTRQAQQLAHRVADQYFDYTGKLSTGMGPPFRPMDAVLNNPFAPPPIAPPGAPPAAPPPAPQNATPPPPPAPTPTPPPGTPPPVPVPTTSPGPTPTPPPAVTEPPQVTPGPAPAPPPTVAPPVPVPWPAPPPPGPVKTPGLRPGVQPPGAQPGAQPPARTPGQAPSPAPKLPPNPGQLTRNAFGKPGPNAPGPGQPPPGRTLRRPGAGQPGQPGNGQPGRPGERGRGDRSEGLERGPGRTVDGQETFGRPSAPTTPPVLKNPAGDRDRKRPGSAEELRPTARAGDGTPGVRLDGTAPPVLNRPNRTADAVPPPGRGRPGAPDSRRTRTTSPGADWVGADEARAEAGAPVLDAPAPPPSGSRVSRLEEVPKNLRSRAATSSTPDRPARPGTVSPELSKRHTGDDRKARQTDDEARGVVTDEQAFEVQTPGGGVVTSQRDEPAYEPEVRRALGGGR